MPPPIRDAMPQILIFGDPDDGAAQALDISGLEKEGVFIIHKDFSQTANSRTKDRNAQGKGFQEGIGQTFM